MKAPASKSAKTRIRVKGTSAAGGIRGQRQDPESRLREERIKEGSASLQSLFQASLFAPYKKKGDV